MPDNPKSLLIFKSNAKTYRIPLHTRSRNPTTLIFVALRSQSKDVNPRNRKIEAISSVNLALSVRIEN